MKVILSVKCEKANFILLESKKKFKLIQISKSEHSTESIFDNYEDAKKCLFESL